MERIKLTRGPSTDEGTFGTLSYCGVDFHSGELPWRNNASDLSCIPVGVYKATVTHSNRFNRDLYEIMGVKDRFAVRIHPANFCGNVSRGKKTELNGCICLGSAVGQLEGQQAILGSKAAVAKFMELLGNQDFELEIV